MIAAATPLRRTEHSVWHQEITANFKKFVDHEAC
jgi:hypothetical protein